MLHEYHGDSINGIETLNLMFETGLIETPFRSYRLTNNLVHIGGTLNAYFVSLLDAMTDLADELRKEKLILIKKY